MRLIDADTLMEKVERIQPWDAYLGKYAQGIRHCMEIVSFLIKDAPTIESSAQPEIKTDGDTISRQAAIDALKEHRALFCDNTPNSFSKLPYGEKCRVDELDNAIATLVNLPSVQPERKMGQWTKDNACPFCGFEPWYERDIHTLSFCPNCGADLRGIEQHE